MNTTMNPSQLTGDGSHLHHQNEEMRAKEEENHVTSKRDCQYPVLTLSLNECAYTFMNKLNSVYI